MLNIFRTIREIRSSIKSLSTVFELTLLFTNLPHSLPNIAPNIIPISIKILNDGMFFEATVCTKLAICEKSII